jgi:flavin-dependent dehydrogenase
VIRAARRSQGAGSAAPEPWDVVVVGAGPAGAVAARGIARRGSSVLLLDQARFPRRKVCGACLGPTAQRWLRSEGLAGLLDELGGVPLHTLELRAGERRADLRLRGNRVVGRARLDAALVEAAIEAGVAFRDGCRVRVMRWAEEAVLLETSGDTIHARSVVDATGLPGLAVPVGVPGFTSSDTDRSRSAVDPEARIGLGAIFEGEADGPPCGVLRMVVGREGYVGLARDEDGSLTIAAAVEPGAVRRRGADGAVAAVLTEAGLRLPAGPIRHQWKGTLPLTRTVPRLGGARVLKIGDAAGYLEPFTGEGIGWAVGSAVAVRPFVECAAAGWTEAIATDWTRAHRRVVGRGRWACAGLARALRHERLVRAAVAALAIAPSMAAPLVHATDRRPARLTGVHTS